MSGVVVPPARGLCPALPSGECPENAAADDDDDDSETPIAGLTYDCPVQPDGTCISAFGVTPSPVNGFCPRNPLSNSCPSRRRRRRRVQASDTSVQVDALSLIISQGLRLLAVADGTTGTVRLVTNETIAEAVQWRTPAGTVPDATAELVCTVGFTGATGECIVCPANTVGRREPLTDTPTCEPCPPNTLCSGESCF